MLIDRPAAAEHPPFALPYIDAAAHSLSVAEHDDILALLATQPAAFQAMLEDADPELVDYAYAPDKWTLGESLVHVADSERVFAYRLLRIARGDTTPLPGFDHDAWVPASGASGRQFSDILTEFWAVRSATVMLIQSLPPEALDRMGTASGHPVSVRALAWMIAGHAAHHLALTHTHYLGG